MMLNIKEFTNTKIILYIALLLILRDVANSQQIQTTNDIVLTQQKYGLPPPANSITADSNTAPFTQGIIDIPKSSKLVANTNENETHMISLMSKTNEEEDKVQKLNDELVIKPDSNPNNGYLNPEDVFKPQEPHVETFWPTNTNVNGGVTQVKKDSDNNFNGYFLKDNIATNNNGYVIKDGVYADNTTNVNSNIRDTNVNSDTEIHNNKMKSLLTDDDINKQTAHATTLKNLLLKGQNGEGNNNTGNNSIKMTLNVILSVLLICVIM